MIQHYELLFIIDVKLEEKDQASMVKKVEEIINQAGGQITKQDNWGKRKFCYEINHEQFGVYVLFEFDCETGSLTDIEPQLKLLSEIVRFVILKKRVKSEKEIAQEQRIKEKIEAKEAAQTEEAEVKPVVAETPKSAAEQEKEKEKVAKTDASKIRLEDLDKKLDEILKEDV